MMSRKIFAALVTCAIFAGDVTTLPAQSRGGRGQVQATRPLSLDDSSVVALMRRERDRGLRGGEITSILRQMKRPHSAVRLDSLADSVTRIIINNTATKGPELERARSLLADLTASGAVASKRGDTVVVQGQGLAYPRVIDRLVEVHKTARAESVRELAIHFMLFLPEKQQALAYLREVAVSKNDPTATWAVHELSLAVLEKIPSAEQILRHLWETRAVTNPRAEDALTAFCQGQGWIRPRIPPPF